MKILFMPECYFDTVLIKKIVKNNELVWHQKGCNNVVKKCLAFKNTFNVGIIDKDKKELKDLSLFDSCSVKGLVVHFREGVNAIIIQLDPPIEKWILNISEEAKINLKDFSLPSEVGKLKYITKSQIAGETKELLDLCDVLLRSESGILNRLKSWVSYLLNNFDKNIDYNFFQN